MNKRIVFKTLDGGCGVIIPTAKALLKMTIEQIAYKDVPEGLDWRIVDIDSIPSDRTFRAAWTDALPTVTVDVDMPKARAIHMVNLRKIRNEKLKALDVEQLKGNDVTAQKQALRDMPDNVNLTVIDTPEELKNYKPEILL
tara:strand:- start:162518 stop:162940 length:423 start_codon:yes stop_codon:yes gene_type:complete